MAPDGLPRVRLTGAGAAVVVVAVACFIVSRVTGVEELSVGAFCLGALVACSVVALRIGGSDLDVERTIRPRRVTVGERCTVEIVVHNGRSGLRLPLEIDDALDGTTVASLTLPQRRTDPACIASYDLPARRRGIARFGPLRVRIVDPFGMAHISMTVPHVVDVIMLPRILPLGVERASGSEDPSGTLRHRRQLTTVSDEFESLREYVPGDDVRRVHWASTARIGRPMVRNHQFPSQRHTTVLLDDRRDGYPSAEGRDAFERAVSAAASTLAACRRRGDLVRLLTSSGIDTDFFDDQQRFDSVLDQLAATATTASGSISVALSTASGAVTGDRIVVCCGLLDDGDIAGLARSAATGSDVVVIGCASVLPADPHRRVLSVPFASGDDLRAAWNAAEAVRGVAPTRVGARQ